MHSTPPGGRQVSPGRKLHSCAFLGTHGCAFVTGSASLVSHFPSSFPNSAKRQRSRNCGDRTACAFSSGICSDQLHPETPFWSIPNPGKTCLLPPPANRTPNQEGSCQGLTANIKTPVSQNCIPPDPTKVTLPTAPRPGKRHGSILAAKVNL